MRRHAAASSPPHLAAPPVGGAPALRAPRPAGGEGGLRWWLAVVAFVLPAAGLVMALLYGAGGGPMSGEPPEVAAWARLRRWLLVATGISLLAGALLWATVVAATEDAPPASETETAPATVEEVAPSDEAPPAAETPDPPLAAETGTAIPAPRPTPPPPVPTPTWSGSLELGFLVVRSDRNTMTGNSGLAGTHTSARGELSVTAAAAYGRTGDDVSTERYDMTFIYDHLPQARLSPSVGAGYTRDLVKDIQSRFEAGPGVIWRFLRRDAGKASLSGGLLYQREVAMLAATDRPGLVEATSESALLSLGLKTSANISDRLTIEHSSAYKPDLRNLADDYRIDSTTSAVNQLTRRLSTKLTLRDLYDNDPAPGVTRNYLEISLSLLTRLGSQPPAGKS